MRTNSKVVREAMRAHILECVISDEGDFFTTFDDAKKHVKNVFEYWSNIHEIRREPNNQKRFSNFLNGIPFNFHFYDEDIKNYLNEIGLNPTGKIYSAEKSLHLYHYLIFKEIFN